MNTITIHQPDFAPYLGFFQRLLQAQHFILLDDVQFIRRGWQHRDRIKTRNGSSWLTLSVRKPDYRQLINEVELSSDSKWKDDNLNLIKECYSSATCFAEIYPKVEALYHAGYRYLVDFNIAFLNLALEYFDISIPVTRSSEYQIDATSSERLLALAKARHGDAYLTGTGSRDYLDEELFRSSGIKIVWQQFKHPVYQQVHGKFEAMLSCLDVLFNCGHDSASVLRSTISD
ncbi:MAG: hypothetical protein AMJ68_05380 [Acidithiobacillales bacterium SG8_45]|nr:MAG: hypothetical protein AMJ68_05380 [Acidithiobacillales bacterium SG8_45]